VCCAATPAGNKLSNSSQDRKGKAEVWRIEAMCMLENKLWKPAADQ
jgi:hypothetical protein